MVDPGRLAVAAGLASIEAGGLDNPWLGNRFGLSAVTTDFAMTPDRPLAPKARQPRWRTHGPAWIFGKGFARNAFNREIFARRPCHLGPYPFESLKRVDKPTTFIDAARIPRVPKRTDMFARAQFGDSSATGGPRVQACARNGHYVRKAAPAAAQRRVPGALALLQDDTPAPAPAPGTDDPRRGRRNHQGHELLSRY